MKRLFLIGFFALCIGKMAMTQSMINTAGTTVAVPGFSLSWSIGEPVISTFTGSSAMLTQGFHQPNYVITNINDTKLSTPDINVYPNPVDGFLTISWNEKNRSGMRASIYSSEGKVLSDNILHKSDERVSFQTFPAGVYILKIGYEPDKEISVFKIVKK